MTPGDLPCSSYRDCNDTPNFFRGACQHEPHGTIGPKATVRRARTQSDDRHTTALRGVSYVSCLHYHPRFLNEAAPYNSILPIECSCARLKYEQRSLSRLLNKVKISSLCFLTADTVVTERQTRTSSSTVVLSRLYMTPVRSLRYWLNSIPL